MLNLTHLDSFQIKRLDFAHGMEWGIFNPSLALHESGFAALLRSSNFRICPHGPFYWGGGGKYEIGVHPLPDNKLYCITLDKELRIKTSKEIDTQTVRQNNDSHCFGFEDARLFRWQNRWWALANSPRAKFLDGNNMTLLELNDDFEINKAVLLASPFDREREKNWTPVIHNDRLFIIYEWQPLSVYEIDPEQYRLQLIKKMDCPFLLDWHGSSQGIAVKNGWLFVIHYRVPKQPHQTIIHSFIELDHEFNPLGMSQPFVFLHRGNEFCGGVAEKDGRFYLSFGGIHDDHAFICSLLKTEVESMLKTFEIEKK